VVVLPHPRLVIVVALPRVDINDRLDHPKAIGQPPPSLRPFEWRYQDDVGAGGLVRQMEGVEQHLLAGFFTSLFGLPDLELFDDRKLVDHKKMQGSHHGFQSHARTSSTVFDIISEGRRTRTIDPLIKSLLLSR
jgi:hypothetical protein